MIGRGESPVIADVAGGGVVMTFQPCRSLVAGDHVAGGHSPYERQDSEHVSLCVGTVLTTPLTWALLSAFRGIRRYVSVYKAV